MSEVIATNQTILVVGGGVSGMTAALEAAECGKQVILVEKNPSLGGRVSQLYKYFPKLCHPKCGLEINLRRTKANRNLRVMAMTEVTNIDGDAGNYSVTLKTAPRYVTDSCTNCGACSDAVEAEFDDEYNYGLSKRKGAYRPFDQSYPERYVLDPAIIGTDDAEKAKAACKYDAIDLDMAETETTITVGAIIWATGWRPYDASKLETYSYTHSADIINNVEMERLANHDGPTGGKVVRPSNGEPAKKVALIQCAGSRDVNHLPYCSMICCLASLKHAAYVLEQYEDAEVHMYYIDIRAHDKMQTFYERIKVDPRIKFIKSKPAEIHVGEDGRPIVKGERTIDRELYEEPYDLVVLATGMEPEAKGISASGDVVMDEDGFVLAVESEDGGQFSCGVAAGPFDVALSTTSGTAAALKAIQAVGAR